VIPATVIPATVIPANWSDADYRWRTKLPGKGHSSPVIWGERLFVLSADTTSARRYALCLDTGSGKLLWQKDYESVTHPLSSLNSYASSTPTVDAHHVYVAWATLDQLTIRALSHEGEEVWRRDLGPYISEHGFGNSPIVFEDLVILVNSQQAEELDPDQQPGTSSVVALDRMTGEVRWTTPRKAARVCYGTPCLYEPPNGPVELICYDTADGFISLDPRTGKENWTFPAFTMRTVASPIIVDDLVFGSNGSGGGGNYLVAVRLTEPRQEVYRIKRQAPYVPTSVAHDGLVYMFFDRGFVSCMQAADGKIVWSERLTSGFSGSPVLVNERVYCMDNEGHVLVLAAGREFKELGRMPLGEPSRATPAVAGGRMFLRSETTIVCIGG
jgi:outer membrane protein assembly factor BamB